MRNGNKFKVFNIVYIVIYKTKFIHLVTCQTVMLRCWEWLFVYIGELYKNFLLRFPHIHAQPASMETGGENGLMAGVGGA